VLAAMNANQERAEFAVSGRPTADDDLVACPALGFGPAVGSAGTIGRIEPFRNNALKRQPASGLPNRIAARFQMVDKANPGRVTRAMVRQQGPKPCLAIGKRLWSQVGSVNRGVPFSSRATITLRRVRKRRRVFGAPQNSTFYAGWPDWPCTAAH
jgi:hypothetical protein